MDDNSGFRKRLFSEMNLCPLPSCSYLLYRSKCVSWLQMRWDRMFQGSSIVMVEVFPLAIFKNL